MRVVAALGGNAILPRGAQGTAEEQRRTVRAACDQLTQLAAQGHELVVTHGNGPQVGRALLQQRAAELEVPPMPLDIVGAGTQGQLGYLIQQQLADALAAAALGRPVATVLTQVVVDVDDPRMARPDKPVGPHYTEVELEHVTGRRLPLGTPETWEVDGLAYAKGSGGTWRRTVPSPLPIDVVEVPAITALLDAGVVPVCCGGGGVPIVRTADGAAGVEAVIDKDRTGALLARRLGADALLVLTDVAHVMTGFGTPDERPLHELTTTEARRLLHVGELGAGSMAPKVEAAVDAAADGLLAVITSLERAADALEGRAGTRVVHG